MTSSRKIEFAELDLTFINSLNQIHERKKNPEFQAEDHRSSFRLRYH